MLSLSLSLSLSRSRSRSRYIHPSMSAINLNHFRILEIEEKVQEPCYLPPSTLSTDTFSFLYPVLEKVQDPCYLPPPTLSTDTFSFPYPVLEKMQDPCYPPPSTDTFSFPYPVLVNTPQNQGATGNLYQQQEAHKLLSIAGSSDHPVSFQIKENNKNNIVERSLANQYTRDQHVHGSSKCMDPKVLLMRKKMSPDQTTVSNPRKSMQTTQDSNRRGNSSSSSTSGVIRVCSDCNTTKTPLWRSGPQGPKSLCNACGIRQRKARRAMAAPSEVKKEKITDGDRIVPFKKRCKFTAKKKLHLDGVAVGLSKDPSLHQVFPQDEKDAAILLMALSCGLLHG